LKLPIKAIVQNSVSKKFDVKGFIWHDGVFFVYNPRPDRYQFKGLVGDRTSRKLFWADDSLEPGEESKFEIYSMLLTTSSKTGKKTRT
jgi:hypothetical protein